MYAETFAQRNLELYLNIWKNLVHILLLDRCTEWLERVSKLFNFTHLSMYVQSQFKINQWVEYDSGFQTIMMHKNEVIEKPKLS